MDVPPDPRTHVHAPAPPDRVERGSWRVVSMRVVAAVWLLNAALTYGRFYLSNQLALKPWPWEEVWWRVGLQNLGDALLWTALTPLVFVVSAGFPLRAGALRRSVPAHLAAMVAVASASCAANFVVFQLTAATPQATSLLRWYVSSLYANMVQYALVMAAWHALDYYRRFRDRELRASQLESQLTRARLQALEMQIQPHFLFNTLNSISELMHEDVAAADRMIGRLGALLRMTTDGAGEQEVTVERELEFLRAYLDIERMRFGDRLWVEVEAAADAMDALVPNMILQPLVENAIRHGFAERAARGRVSIHAWRAGGTLRLEVRDDGAGLGASHVRERVGLRNTRTRLRQLYGDAHRFEVAGATGGGTLALVEIPFRRDERLPVGREAAAG